MTPRQRLAAYGTQLGWGSETLILAAQAAFPGFTPGERLDDEQTTALCSAVETLAQAGRDAENLPALIDHYRQHHGEQWRTRFWDQTARTATLRHSHPELYGLSPLETDPQRLARYGPAATSEPPEPSTAAPALAA